MDTLELCGVWIVTVILGFITYSREELLNIRLTSTHHRSYQEYDFPETDPVFCLPPNTMDLIPAGDPVRRRKRGKRGGLVVRLRRRAHRAPLPSILLANVQSLDNKVDEIRARVAFQRDIRDCNVLCFTETWLTQETLTESVQPAGFFMHRADRNKHLSGKQLAMLNTSSAVRTCGFDFSGNIIMFSTDKQMGYQCFLNYFDLRDPQQIEDNQPYLTVPCAESKITSAVWGPLGEFVIAGHENGEINQFSAKSGEVLKKVKEHNKQINDIQTSVDLTMVITASKDCSSKVVMGGGQEAMEVTTTSTRIGKFEARFFHAAYEEEFGRVKGHFGPINCVAFHPDGKSYSSGGEDGYTRIHHFDPQYFDFELEA
ncbi:eukaryotic translation initiation factor 3 subunit I isoform X2 [Salvelinus alpinus]|uniref:eukaryotic translation initiation factor 3 subunit I isoform X2 n=1 Tax=Salvelinus alpinus TaxID=8036 RepID=UPI0039FC709A